VLGHTESKPGMSGNVYANLVALGCLVVHLAGKSSVKTRLIDSRSKQHVLRIDEDVKDTALKFEDIPYNLDNVDAIVVSDYDKGYISYELVDQLINNFKGPVFVDTKKKDLARFKKCIIKINQKEFNESISHPDESTRLVVTCGENGAMFRGTIVSSPTVEVVDVTGAGDTFLAALVYEYLIQEYIIAAMRFAVKASAITVQHLGCYAPSLEEIK
jgi:D-beta-D-heptose 7-phosphate kinase/D-beta-D-heptose 1-phosphate adenosyltransferase